MSAKRWDLLVLAVVFTGIGVLGGYVALRQSAPGPTEPEADHHHEDHPDDAEHHHGEPLPPQTLRNLGVTVAVAKPSHYVVHREIAATIVEMPLTQRPVPAPMGGRVREVHVAPGAVVAAGEILVTIVRDPIPRPALTLTEELLEPGRESIHASVLELRRSKQEMEIARTELERLEQFTGTVGGEELPVLPRQSAIDQRYQLLRSESAYEQARLELQKHGFSPEQIAAVEEGGPIPDVSEATWKRALERSGFWPPRAQRVLELLPENMRRMPWVIATIGELAAGGLLEDELLAWLEEVPKDCDHFLEIGSLLQRGYTVADVRHLHDLGALDPLMKITAPEEGDVPDWDVQAVLARPGTRVEAGSPLVTLADRRFVHVRSEPVGDEQADIVRAVAEGLACEARPLVAGTGPDLVGLTIELVTSDEGARGTIALATARNEPLARTEGEGQVAYRSWKLRPGMRYLLRIPVKSLGEVFVLPRDAVAADGPHRIVFVEEEDGFRRAHVEVVHEDARSVVIAIDEDTEIAPGDRVVQSGAYALAIALEAGSQEIDAHAGHGH